MRGPWVGSETTTGPPAKHPKIGPVVVVLNQCTVDVDANSSKHVPCSALWVDEGLGIDVRRPQSPSSS